MKLLSLIILAILSFSLQKCKSVEIGSPEPIKTDTTTYTCAGKTKCTEMKSCAEAEYYLDHCPYVEMDGDLDGIPCEEQLCGH